jgi:hypothetical protein
MYHRHHQNRNAIDERQRPDQPIANSVQPSGQAVQLVGVLDRIAQLLV